MVLIEHGVLLTAGLALGIAAAAGAVLPAVLRTGTEVPYSSLAWTLEAVLEEIAAEIAAPQLGRPTSI